MFAFKSRMNFKMNRICNEDRTTILILFQQYLPTLWHYSKYFIFKSTAIPYKAKKIFNACIFSICILGFGRKFFAFSVLTFFFILKQTQNKKTLEKIRKYFLTKLFLSLVKLKKNLEMLLWRH